MLIYKSIGSDHNECSSNTHATWHQRRCRMSESVADLDDRRAEEDVVGHACGSKDSDSAEQLPGIGQNLPTGTNHCKPLTELVCYLTLYWHCIQSRYGSHAKTSAAISNWLLLNTELRPWISNFNLH